MAKDNYKPGTLIYCQGIRGVVIYPRKKGKVSVVWNGMDEIDDYQGGWLSEHCETSWEMSEKRAREMHAFREQLNLTKIAI